MDFFLNLRFKLKSIVFSSHRSLVQISSMMADDVVQSFSANVIHAVFFNFGNINAKYLKQKRIDPIRSNRIESNRINLKYYKNSVRK